MSLLNTSTLSLVVIALLQAPLPAGAEDPSSVTKQLQKPSSANRFLQHAARPIPLTFAPNVGQAPASSRFIASGSRYSLSLENTGLTLMARTPGSSTPSSNGAPLATAPLTKPTHSRQSDWRTSSAHLDFVGANPDAKPEGLDASTAHVNYFFGKDPSKWKSNVPLYSRIRYRNLYPGVDMLFYGKPNGELEYDLVVAPNADPGQIRFHVAADQKPALDADGNLPLDGKDGAISLARPMLYQDIDRGKKAIAGSFVQVAENEFAVKVNGYDRTKPLIIDPTISLLYSTYIGGRHEDDAEQLVLDAQNNAYIVGFSASEDLPVSGNAYQPIRSNVGTYTYDATVLKFTSSGVLLYSTFIGGTGNDYGSGIAIDSAGNAYVTGSTSSTDLPTTANAYSTTPGSGFLAELSPDGSTLEYSSYYNGGNSLIALNKQGQVVVAGTAGPGLNTTAGSYKPSLAQGQAAFAAIFDLTKPAAQQLIAASYYGTDSPMSNSVLTGNTAFTMVLDGNGDVWMGGQAYTPNLPTTANAYQPSVPAISSGCSGYGAPLNSAAFMAELSPDLSKLVYATYFSGKTVNPNGPDCSEFLNRMVFDSSGNLYAIGSTGSSSFPVTAGVLQNSYPGQNGFYSYIGWVAKFSPNTPAPAWSTYFGGNGGDTFVGGKTSAVDPAGNLWLVGQTQGGSNFPISANAYQSTLAGGYDAFVSQIKADGTQILYSTYLGGSGSDDATAVAVDSSSNVYIVGATASGNFPVTSDAFQSQYGEGCPSGCDGNDMFFTILGSGTIGSVGPTVGGNTGDTTVTVSGAGFQSGATCSLVQGSTTIAAATATVNSSGTSISCTFALNSAATGSYDVVVSNPGGSSLAKPAAFTVEAGGSPSLSVSLIGRPKIRTGLPSTFYVSVSNSGNENAYFIPLWLTLPTSITFSLGGSVQQGTTAIYSAIGNTAYANTILWQLAPGQTTAIPLQITSSVDSSAIPLYAALQPPWFSTSAEVDAAIESNTYIPACVTDPENSYFVNCFGPYLISIETGATFFSASSTSTAVGASPANDAATQPADSCSIGPTPRSDINKAGQQAGYNDFKNNRSATETPNPYNPYSDTGRYNDWQDGYNLGYNGQMPPPKNSNVASNVSGFAGGSSIAVPAATSQCQVPPPNLTPPAMQNPGSGGAIDPNYKSGPSGDGSTSQFVRGTSALTYNVGFENEATATLPAATVIVTDQLDPTKVDLTTLSLGTIAFGSNIINLPSGTSNYTTTYTPSGVTSYVVRIQGSLNSTTGLLKWTFQTIDPTTGLPPSDPTVGFLPPDTDGIVGQGSVLFNVMPKAGLTTGTQITNTATVVFDANAPINTPSWLNTIDANAPVSMVTALPSQEPNPTFTVAWTGTDVGSGIASYTIYVSDNGGTYTAWQSGVTTTSASYAGQAGHTYAFYSIATDGAGNTEAAKGSPDTTTTVASTQTPATVTLSNLAQTYTGSPLAVTVATTPAGLPATVTYSSATYTASSTPPTNAGSYSVTATINSTTYSGSATGTLVISPATATITLGNLAQTYTGSPATPVTATTTPAGLTVAITYSSATYSSSATPPTAAGSYTVSATVNNANYTGGTTGTLVISAAPPTSPVTYLGLDSTTQGQWTGKYGSDGYQIANGATSLPAYATVSFTGDSLYTWAPQTTDPRALQTVPSATTGIASSYYANPSFNINLNLTDGNSHRVALYLLDWDTTARNETISILDATTHAVLDSESFSGFHNGQWAAWNIKGNVIIQVKNNMPYGNATISGIFFGPATSTTPPVGPPSPSSATYNGLDTTTQGAWTGKYGGDGYQIANGATKLPAYATVSITGDSTYTWAAQTSDPRALQTSSGSSTGIASTYYANASFDINLNLTDSNSHVVALYLLDFDTTARAETITIYDAATNTILDSESFSGFHNGQWAVWTIKGDVIIQVTSSNSSAAVVSGLFFGPAGSGTPPPPTPPTTASASYVGTDATTEGTWTGTYGGDGYQIANGASSLPAYATVSVTGDSTYTWATHTTDPRALQTASAASTRIASTYYASSTFNINVNLTDGNSHTVALYLLDFDTTARAETIKILDASSNTVLDTESFTGFHNGQWAVWTIKGNVIIQITSNNSSTAAVSGIFFGPAGAVTPPPPPSNPSSATYSGLDTTTEGKWTGKFGSDGYQIANGPVSLPSYATLTLTGDSTYTWATQTTDPRALQLSPGSATGIASTYYASSSFNLNLNLADGNTHKVSLYLLDWDTTSRAETIKILDAVTNTVLDTESFTGFHTGQWATWQIKGNVIIQIQTTNYANATLSGIFFN